MKRRDAPPASMGEVRALLACAAEEEYRAFASALLPGTSHVLGVRLPYLRRLAGQIAKAPWARAWLENHPAPESFEETMLLGFVTAALPTESFEERLDGIARFVPYIDNWSVCDSFCISLKDVRKNRVRTFAFLMPYLQSENEFAARFGAVMLLDHFVCDDWLDASLQALSAIPSQAHYARMAVAWAVQTFYAAYPEAVETFLLQERLDASTTALAVNKIAQSRRCTPEALAHLRAHSWKKPLPVHPARG